MAIIWFLVAVACIEAITTDPAGQMFDSHTDYWSAGEGGGHPLQEAHLDCSGNHSHNCPAWTTCTVVNGSEECICCAELQGFIQCNNNCTFLSVCYWMSFNEGL